MQKINKQKGITLIALVVTIIVLLILAGISIATLTGENGLITKTNTAKEKTKQAEAEERVKIEVLGSYGTDGKIDIDLLNNNLKAHITGLTYNRNKLSESNKIERLPATVVVDGYEIEIAENGRVTVKGKTGEVKENEFVADGSWNEKSQVNTPKLLEGMTGVYWDDNGQEVDVTKDNQENWYNYSEQKWANAKTIDGSYWVWIPRYEYKINSNDKTINVKFIKTETITVDNDYTYIHPAFTNGTKNNFKNGEWDKEIPGFWVAKYAAGFQECTQKITNGNIIEPTTDPNKVTYSNKTYTSFSNEGQITNALSQELTESEYASQKISYPVFKPLTYAYNIISTGDSYTISQEIAKARDFYGLDQNTADSHMMKNSEWGAVVYLSHSNYGINDKKVEMNTKNLINFDKFIFSVTGYAGDIPNGVSASTTNNKTGVFDLSGCVWERVSAYITNGNTSLTTYGKSYATLKTSTKYATIYPYNEVDDSNTNNYLEYKNAKYGYGDAVLETSTSETSTSEQEQLTNAWENNYSNYPYTHGTFFVRGGDCSNIGKAGIFAFTNATGNPQQVNGFRAILIGTK